MATRRRIKPTLNLNLCRKPVKEEKNQDNILANVEKNDENKLFKLPPQELEIVEKDIDSNSGHIAGSGCQSPTKLKPPKIRPNLTTSISQNHNTDHNENDEERGARVQMRFDSMVPSPFAGYNRMRTESVSSTKSSVANFYNRDRKDSHRIRQISRCEEPTRPVETKKEIKSRYANLDKLRLTMYDMIYYNPSGNPMQKKPILPKSITAEDAEKTDSKSNIVSPVKEDVKSALQSPKIEESRTVPVPQLKLGPNGELILDEKSLTIENAKEKEIREQMANSKIQYDDEYSNNYGYYKRQKRTKDWLPDETVKFYKCLHTIGTDFSLMLTLFPKRSRRDLKLKYKKEERHNSALINKALLHPKRFNIEELEEELKLEEEAKEEAARKEEEEARLEKTRVPKRNAQIESSKTKAPQKKISKAMRDMTDGDLVYDNPRRPKKRKMVMPKVETVTAPTPLSPLNDVVVVSASLPPTNLYNMQSSNYAIDEPYRPNLEIEDNKNYLHFQVTANMELEPIDSKPFQIPKLGINHEIGYFNNNESQCSYPALDHNSCQLFVPPPSPSRMLPPASPARSLPPQSPRSTDNPITLSNLSELELDSLVLVESQDPNNPETTRYEVHILDENGEMSEKPLELSQDVIDSIKTAMMNDS